MSVPRLRPGAAALLAAIVLVLPAPAAAELRIIVPPPGTYTTGRTIAVMGLALDESWMKDRDTVSVRVNDGRPENFKLQDGWFFAGEVYLGDGANTITVEKQSVQVTAGDSQTPPRGFDFANGHLSIEDTCDSCHTLAEEVSEAGATKAVVTLLEPPDTLCNWCHSQVSHPPLKGAATLHDPVRQGKCLSCHFPHAAARPAMLREDRKGLCRLCHQPLFDDIASKPHVHGPINVGDCSLCHATHAGRPGLLKEDQKDVCLTCHTAAEIFSTLTGAPSHPGIQEGKCHDCHNSHASSNARLMKKIVNNLCVECHPEKSHNFHEEKGFSIYICGRCHEVHRPDTIKLVVHRSKELCESCHTELGQGEFVHEALSKGNCFECHGFHGEPMGPRQAPVCGRCHPRNEAFAAAHPVAMSEEVRCTTCHSPHQSPNRDLTLHVRHRPFAEKKCASCHREDGSVAAEARGVESLCFSCHPDKRLPAEKEAGTIVHKPFNNAACSSCHLTHNSANPYLLSTSTLDLCGRCHSFAKKLKILSPISAHSAVIEGRCGDCHDSHIGRNAKLLKRPAGELCLGCHGSLIQGVSVPHVPLEKGICADCHLGHTSRYPSLLKNKELELCRKCHATILRTFEAAAPGKVVHDPVSKGQCGKCHGIHGGTAAHLLKAPGNDLCRPCHPTFKRASHHRYGEDYLTYQADALKGQEIPCQRCHKSHYALNRSLIADIADPICKACHEI